MYREIIKNAYFDWMRDVTFDERYTQWRPYFKLLTYLNNVAFRYINPMDGNRAEDGVNLRYRYGEENNVDRHMVARYLDDRDCTVLEMMVALALRCEHQIMEDDDFGDRTGHWFWGMIDSLGLLDEYDDVFDEDHVADVVYQFLNREYDRNGKGGLFTVENPPRDMRNVDIWYQMNYYLIEVHK